MNSNSVRSCNALSARGSGKSSKHSENCFIGCSIPIRSHLQNQFLPALQLLTYIPNMRFPCPPGEGNTQHPLTYFAGLSALSALALHSERNFLRSLPCRPLASASFEHSSEAAVRGFSAFFSAGALVSDLGASVLAGAAVCAEAAPISSSEATAVAVAKAEILIMGLPRLKTRAQPSRRNAEPEMNGSLHPAFSPLCRKL